MQQLTAGPAEPRVPWPQLLKKGFSIVKAVVMLPSARLGRCRAWTWKTWKRLRYEITKEAAHAALRVSGGLAWGSSRRALVLVLELSQQLITQQTVNNILHLQGFTRCWGAQVCTFDPVQALWTDFFGL